MSRIRRTPDMRLFRDRGRLAISLDYPPPDWLPIKPIIRFLKRSFRTRVITVKSDFITGASVWRLQIQDSHIVVDQSEYGEIEISTECQCADALIKEIADGLQREFGPQND